MANDLNYPIFMSSFVFGGQLVGQFGIPDSNRHTFVLDMEVVDTGAQSCDGDMARLAVDDHAAPLSRRPSRSQSIDSSLSGSTLVDDPQAYGADEVASEAPWQLPDPAPILVADTLAREAQPLSSRTTEESCWRSGWKKLKRGLRELGNG